MAQSRKDGTHKLLTEAYDQVKAGAKPPTETPKTSAPAPDSSVEAYLQGAGGEEFELRVETPDPVDEGVIDRTIFLPPEAIKALAKQKDPNYFWVRVVI